MSRRELDITDAYEMFSGLQLTESQIDDLQKKPEVVQLKKTETVINQNPPHKAPPFTTTIADRPGKRNKLGLA